ncbi:MAG: ABC transporter ATP-binding protein [Oscillatoriophycideae cyanobacterium NC_groundwater_1537_Pr4_S-0.65um_50_18]|nr:ABC transporter ATP-binding protein [Oscillatoriophycideae cyanobacterium NC_groundwater_1537_Pr4_S-0.65um_50_18]
MSNVLVQVENLSKKYTLGQQQQERYQSLRDVMAKQVRKLGQTFLRPKHSATPAKEDFWALRDVSFEIQQGDRVGIIGRNGAGKSTLLKILSRITEPTQGQIRIRGRVASLLEVGTGFHPELTGRENIFLNGAILGMGKAEIHRKFDEIVAFAEVEKFLDTPVKRYSSGMYVRLAFAVAAHLEPEILIVDEVLAVGDAQFQQKCLGKMQDVGQAGKTVLFVSHNMGSISTLCNQGIYLKQGQVVYTGSIHDTIKTYMMAFQRGESQAPGVLFKRELCSSKLDAFQILEVALHDQNLELKPVTQTWDFVRIRIHFYSPRPISHSSVELAISTYAGNKLIQYSTQPLSGIPLSFAEGEAYIDCVIPKLPLASGSYQISVGLAMPMIEWLCWEENIATLEVGEADVYRSKLPPHQDRTPVVVEHRWECPGQKPLTHESVYTFGY